MTSEPTWSTPEPVVVPAAARYTLEALDETWDVQVWVPEGAENPPVLYLTDPSATVSTTFTTALTLQTLSRGALTAPAVVGVGPAGAFTETHGKRFRDMTPTDRTLEAHQAAATHGLGKADDFLALLVDVVAPHVEAAHGLSAEGRGVGGWSLGGLLACHALLTRPADFDRFLGVSPSLWWDDELLVTRAAEVAPGSLDGARVYLGTGELENDVARMWPPIPEELRPLVEATLSQADMCGAAERFDKALSGSGAAVTREVLQAEHHVTVWGAAMTRGLIALYS